MPPLSQNHIMKTAIILFRNDFRLEDQAALYAASLQADHLIPLYIHDDKQSDNPGLASLSYLHYSLKSLQQDLQDGYQNPLIIRRGTLQEELQKIIEQSQADALYFGNCLDGLYSASDSQIMSLSCEVYMYNTRYLIESHQLSTQKGDSFKVFTPYYKSFLKTIQVRPQWPKPKTLPRPNKPLSSLKIEELQLLPQIPWDKNFYQKTIPGEKAAQDNWSIFLQKRLNKYSHERNFPTLEATSKLSTALHFGEISPVQIYHHSQKSTAKEEASQFRRQVIWRDFAHYCLVHYPQMRRQEFHDKFAQFPWENDHQKFHAWSKGQTGYPIIDAAMRELWQTGIMHNRCRMIVASFLVKDLLIDWRWGMKHFEETLIDADIANNVFAWQWAAGCGLDAAPYYRIFNPWTQSAKFDKEAEYIKKWIPELSHLPAKNLHSTKLMQDSLIVNYPPPILSHDQARIKALEIYKTL